jgi:hypothetical protein
MDGAGSPNVGSGAIGGSGISGTSGDGSTEPR